MLKAVFDWFRSPSPKAFAPAVQPEAAPYKVEAPNAPKVLKTPAEVEVSAAKFTEELKSPSDLVVESLAPAAVSTPAKCGCGRSPTGLCVGLHKLTPEQWAAEQARGSCQKVNNSCDTPAETGAPVAAAKKPAVKKTAPAKKPAARKPAAKKPQ